MQIVDVWFVTGIPCFIWISWWKWICFLSVILMSFCNFLILWREERGVINRRFRRCGFTDWSTVGIYVKLKTCHWYRNVYLKQLFTLKLWYCDNRIEQKKSFFDWIIVYRQLYIIMLCLNRLFFVQVLNFSLLYWSHILKN